MPETPKTQSFELQLQGMTCAGCVRKIEKSLTGVPGVRTAHVNLATERATVLGAPSLTRVSLVEAVRRIGYDVAEARIGDVTGEAARAADVDTKWRRFLFAALLTVPLVVISMAPHVGLFDLPRRALWEFALATPVMVYSGRQFYAGAWKALRNRSATMDTLVATGITAAYGYSLVTTFVPGFPDTSTYYETAAVIVTLILLGKYFEAKSKSRASQALTRLLELGATEARLWREEGWKRVPVDQVQVGDRLLVKPGEKIPVDGKVIEGTSAVDESMVTGESMPVEKGAAANVIGSTLNRNGALTIQATRIGKDTMLSQIIQFVDEAQATRAPIQRLVDSVTSWFVPVVLGIAVLAFIGWLTVGASAAGAAGYSPGTLALLTSIAVLIIACPCAMGLATPMAIMVGMGKGAEHGILVKGAETLERTKRVDTVVLDKTGTLTRGSPQVTDVDPVNGSPDDLVAVAAIVEAGSNHPLAEAIVARAGLSAAAAPANFLNVPGEGVVADHELGRIRVGRPEWLTREGIEWEERGAELERLRSQGKTVVGVARDLDFLGFIAIADAIKPTSLEAVRRLQHDGLRLVLLTGDHPQTANAVAAQLGIKEVKAEVLPNQKARAVQDLQAEGRVVAMVGDGVNDAPALAVADLGIAMGAGTDVAKEAGHVVLLRNDVRDAAAALHLSRATLRKIYQNLAWAFGYNVLLIPLAAGLFVAWPLLGGPVLLHPSLAAAAMAVSSVSVVANSGLLKAWRPFHSAVPPVPPIAEGRPRPPSPTEAA